MCFKDFPNQRGDILAGVEGVLDPEPGGLSELSAPVRIRAK
jgi:hypothetical protein